MKKKAPNYTTIYTARDGVRWHLTSRNGRKLAESGEAYTRRDAAEVGLRAALVAGCKFFGLESPFVLNEQLNRSRAKVEEQAGTIRAMQVRLNNAIINPPVFVDERTL